MYSAIAKNKRNTFIIMAVFVASFVAIGWFLSYIFNSPALIIICSLFAAIYALIQYFSASKLAVASSGAKEIARDNHEYRELFNIVENLCISQGLPMPRLYIMADKAPNAFASGKSPKDAIICVTDGILKTLNKRELTGVLAHELSHIKNYDIRLNIIVFGLVSAIGMICNMLLYISIFGGFANSRNNKNSAGMAVYALCAIFLAILGPFMASIIQMAISRQREYLADASGALMTRDPEALASALHKISINSAPLQKQNAAMAHMYISNPLKNDFFDNLFATHPPIEKRIKRLLENKF